MGRMNMSVRSTLLPVAITSTESVKMPISSGADTPMTAMMQSSVVLTTATAGLSFASR
ncbi:MAG: hypothetical protein Q4D81_03720 [Eubacteriales bacterium]|nr:hypothetical protein [Eubacteriales bacterium]